MEKRTGSGHLDGEEGGPGKISRKKKKILGVKKEGKESSSTERARRRSRGTNPFTKKR